uniref:Ectonucleoside triphosphate diphosphohydrolase 6 n=1 Tax=Rhinolophus ferrumequinum TaxID=59479 RepID=A0A671EW94_RHIFE
MEENGVCFQGRYEVWKYIFEGTERNQFILKMVWRYLKNLKMELPYDPVIPLLGIYPEKSKAPIQKSLCTPMFIAALYTIAKTWKQPKCPSVDDWIKKLWYIYTMEYYAAIKKKEILPFAMTWMDLGNIMLMVTTLTHEIFKALQPGLSTYADDVEKSTAGILELLDVAKQDIPFDFWNATPLVLEATAGLRLLPGEKAQNLLQKVKEVFKASPFLVGDDCVSIMKGTNKGVSAWVTVSFLTGILKTSGSSSVGMLDLGGGSTQITFLPRVQGTLQTSLPGYLTSLQMFNRTYKLYSYSYLGLGLMSARLAILGGIEGKPAEDEKELVSPCLSPNVKGEWEHSGTVDLSFIDVSEILQNKVHIMEEVKDVDFHAFSYYYDLAANVDLVGKGGWARNLDMDPWAEGLCQGAFCDVTMWLSEFGFPRNKVIKLTRKIDNFETSWALGAIFHYIDSINGQKNWAT